MGTVSRARLIVDLIRRPRVHRYGPEPSQRADLHLPAGPGPFPVAVLIHGGSWVAQYGKIIMRGLAGDLARRGWAVWNLEYRRLGRGQGGGWPATLEDVAAGVDALADLDVPLALDRAVFIGHSAGGQLALWAAGRPGLPDGAPGAHPRVTASAAVSQAGVVDMTGTYRAPPRGTVAAFLGGSPETVPERYAVADPIRHVPLGLPVLLIHGTGDETVSVRRSRDYANAARAAGDVVESIELDSASGGHRAHIDPDGESWSSVLAWLALLHFAP